MMNGAATTYVWKIQTESSPSTMSAELINPFDTSADVLGVNLLSELRHLQEGNTCEGHQVVPEYLSTRKVVAEMHGNKSSTWKSFHGVRRYHERVCAGKS